MSDAGISDAGNPPVALPTFSDNPCAQLSKLASGSYTKTVARWVAQDKSSPRRAGQVVFVGSSSIRLWERLYQDFAPLDPIQRGFGGSRIWDSAEHAVDLITRHKPAAVVIYAGTNDIAAKHTAAQTFDGYRCLVQRIAANGPPIPIVFITVTPTPARWTSWPTAKALHASVKALAAKWSGLHVIDPSAAFLQTGSPPTTSLFVADKLHLNAAGYALWTAVIGPALTQIGIDVQPPPKPTPAKGRRWLIDLGPSNAEDGAPTKSPDAHGQHWNSWHDVDGGSQLLPGESLGTLRDTTGKKTTARLIISGAMIPNGIVNGGLTKPDTKLLGKLAVHTATQDYLYVGAGKIGAMTLTGLEPGASYKLRLFASRNSTETRITRYRLTDASGTKEATLKTSGKGIGGTGSVNGNTGQFAVFSSVKADKHGNLHLDVTVKQGQYGYLALLELSGPP